MTGLDQSLETTLPFEAMVRYKDRPVGTRRVDFLVDDVISVEIKALTKLEDVHFAQAINYLEAYNLEVGLLINFGARSLGFHRLNNSKYNPDKPYTQQIHFTNKQKKLIT